MAENVDFLNVLKTSYNNYEIKDCSNIVTNMDKYNKITNICIVKTNLIVYIKRNKLNESIFKKIELYEIIYHKNALKINSLVINKDNFIHINKELDKTSFLRLVNNTLLVDKAECPVCYEDVRELPNIYCEGCSSCMCKDCYYKLENYECPLCRSDISKQPVIIKFI